MPCYSIITRRPSVIWIVGTLLALTLAATPAAADEFRGMWVSRFEWPSSNQSTCQSNINNIMSTLAAHRFNAVMFQVRGQADTLYPSPYEPWSPLVSSDGNTPPGWGSFDPLAYAVSAAHANGLEFHAYINTHTCYQSGSHTPPSVGWHLYYQHCNASDPNARDWLIHSVSGPVQWEESDYVWLAPGVPDYQAYMRRQIMYVVDNYDVDGVHFDRIRTPWTTYSYDPISQARRAGEGNPNNLSFSPWTRDQITRLLRDLYAQITEVKPLVKTSASIFPTSYIDRHQDPYQWLAAGALDAAAPMIYGSHSYFTSTLPSWISMTNSSGRHLWAGHSIGSTTIDDIIANIYSTRSAGAAGNIVFSFSGINTSEAPGPYWTAFSDPGGPYATSDVIPTMSWKTSPSKGVIIGNVTDLDGDPIVDTHVTRNGSTYTGLSSGDGLYSFLEVPGGTYTVTFNKLGLDPASVPGVSVSAGSVTRLDVVLDDGAIVTIDADDTTIRKNQSVHFTPSITVPDNGGIQSYTWHFGNGDVPGTGMPGETDRAYDEVDTYDVSLEVLTTAGVTVFSNEITITVYPWPGDFDDDGDVDMEDFGQMQLCLSGSTIPQEDPDCQSANFDGDSDVDQADMNVFRGCLGGADLPGNPDCAD